MITIIGLGQIRKTVGYQNLNEDYDFLDQIIGKGKFGVRLALHKKQNEKVAIKILFKENLKDKNSYLIRNEIEILKISQHPNIIRIYNVYENVKFIYISKIILTGTYLNP